MGFGLYIFKTIGDTPHLTPKVHKFGQTMI